MCSQKTGVKCAYLRQRHLKHRLGSRFKSSVYTLKKKIKKYKVLSTFNLILSLFDIRRKCRFLYE